MAYRPRFSKATKERIRKRVSWLEKPARAGVLNEYIAQAISVSHRVVKSNDGKTRFYPKPVPLFAFLCAFEIALLTEDDFLIAYTWVTLAIHLRKDVLYRQVAKHLLFLNQLSMRAISTPREQKLVELLRVLIEKASVHSKSGSKVNSLHRVAKAA